MQTSNIQIISDSILNTTFAVSLNAERIGYIETCRAGFRADLYEPKLSLEFCEVFASLEEAQNAVLALFPAPTAYTADIAEGAAISSICRDAILRKVEARDLEARYQAAAAEEADVEYSRWQAEMAAEDEDDEADDDYQDESDEIETEEEREERENREWEQERDRMQRECDERRDAEEEGEARLQERWAREKESAEMDARGEMEAWEKAREADEELEQIIAEFTTPEGVVKFIGFPSKTRVELNGEEVGDAYKAQSDAYITRTGFDYYPDWGSKIEAESLEEVSQIVCKKATDKRLQKKAFDISREVFYKYGFYGNPNFIRSVLETHGEDVAINFKEIAYNTIEIELGIDKELGDKRQNWQASDWEAAALFMMNKGGRISTDVQRYIAPKLGIQALIFHAQNEGYWYPVFQYHNEIMRRIETIKNQGFLLLIQPQIMELESCKAAKYGGERLKQSAQNLLEKFINHLALLGAQ